MKDLEIVIKKIRKLYESGSKGRGGLVTFLLKTQLIMILLE